MPTRILGALINKAKEIYSLTKKDFLDSINADIPSDFNASIAAEFDKRLKKEFPEHKPLNSEEKKAREDLHKYAVKNVGEVLYNYTRGLTNVEGVDKLSRGFQAIFPCLGDSPEENAHKADIVNTIKNGTTEKRHDLFMKVMKIMADFPMDDYLKMNDKEKIDSMSITLPIAFMGFDGLYILEEFKKLDCGITEEETKQFEKLSAKLLDVSTDIQFRMDLMLNPYYPALDCTHLPDGEEDVEKIDFIQTRLMQEKGGRATENEKLFPSFNELRVAENDYLGICFGEFEGSIVNGFLANGIPASENHLHQCDENGEIIVGESQRETIERLRNGEKLYFKSSAKGSEGQILAFADFKGNGNPVNVPKDFKMPVKPKEVAEPNGFIKFIDSVNRFFGGKGLDSVNKYNDYLEQCGQYRTDMAELDEKYNTGVTATTEFGRVAKEIKDHFKQRGTEKVAESEVKKTEDRVERGRRVAMEFMSCPERMTLMDKKWAQDNPDAIRDAYIYFKEGFLKEKKAPYSEEVQNAVSEFDKNIAACEKAMEQLSAEKSEPSINNEISTSRHQQISEPVKKKDAAINVPQ